MPPFNLKEGFCSQEEGLEKLNKFEGISLKVQNLDEEIDEERLCQEFSRFGRVLSTEVKPQERSRMRCGVVNFISPAEAGKAIQQLNGSVLVSNVLYVTLASSSQNRRRTSSSRRPSLPMLMPLQRRSSSTDLASWESSSSSISSMGTSPTTLMGTSPGASLIHFKRSLCRTVSN